MEQAGTKPGPWTTSNDDNECFERPSGKYHEIEEPGRALLRRAAEPPRPVLPKAHSRRTWTAKGRERDPLQSSLTGSGRAGKPGRLLGSAGGVYEGAVLAGRPHGWGRYFAPHPDPAKGTLVLEYEGGFIRGQRTGQGTRHYAATGERYTGDWAAGRRHGTGRHEYAGGTVYEGAWVRDRREGPGRLLTAAGDVFVGNFHTDRRQGLGVLYLATKGKKLVGEWVDDSPISATLLDLASDDLEPSELYGLSEDLARAAARHRLAAAEGAAPEPQPLPPVHLEQPAKVLAREFVAIRAAREAEPSPAVGRQNSAGGAITGRAVVQHSGVGTVSGTSRPVGGGRKQRGGRGGGGGGISSDGTLTAEQLELLRHAFVLMTGSASRRARLLPRQLPELAVLAGLDPAAPSTVALLSAICARAESGDEAGDLLCGSLPHVPPGTARRAFGGASIARTSASLGSTVVGSSGIGLDGLLYAAMHFRAAPLAVGGLLSGGGQGMAGANGGAAGGTQEALRLPDVEGSFSGCADEEGEIGLSPAGATSFGDAAVAAGEQAARSIDGGQGAVDSEGDTGGGEADALAGDAQHASEQWVEGVGLWPQAEGGVDGTVQQLEIETAAVVAAPGTAEVPLSSAAGAEEAETSGAVEAEVIEAAAPDGEATAAALTAAEAAAPAAPSEEPAAPSQQTLPAEDDTPRSEGHEGGDGEQQQQPEADGTPAIEAVAVAEEATAGGDSAVSDMMSGGAPQQQHESMEGEDAGIGAVASDGQAAAE